MRVERSISVIRALKNILHQDRFMRRNLLKKDEWWVMSGDAKGSYSIAIQNICSISCPIAWRRRQSLSRRSSCELWVNGTGCDAVLCNLFTSEVYVDASDWTGDGGFRMGVFATVAWEIQARRILSQGALAFLIYDSCCSSEENCNSENSVNLFHLKWIDCKCGRVAPREWGMARSGAADVAGRGQQDSCKLCDGVWARGL